MRWKELLKNYKPPVDPDVRESIPLYLRECKNNQINNTVRDDVTDGLSKEVVDEEQMVFLNLTAKVRLR